MLSFPLGETYPTTCDGPGSTALSEGWSSPERDYTWSEGPRASLAIRLAPNRARRLQLRLDGMLAPAAMSVWVSTGGQSLQEIWKFEPSSREQSIILSLPPPPATDPVLSIELGFSNTFCPKDAGLGADGRHLGFALRSFTISEKPLLPAAVKPLIQRCSPALTLALSTQLPDGNTSLSGLLAESGLSGSLITLSGAETDQVGWRENQRPIPAPQFAAPPGSTNNEAFRDEDRNRGGAWEPSPSGLREIGFTGTLPQLLAELTQQGSFLDLIVVADSLFGTVLDALAPIVAAVPHALPDIAICTDDDALLITTYWLRHRASYERVMPSFAVAILDQGLISLIRRTARSTLLPK